MERTFVMFKPDCLERGLVGRILTERARFHAAIARYQEHRAAAVRAYFGEDEQLA